MHGVILIGNLTVITAVLKDTTVYEILKVGLSWKRWARLILTNNSMSELSQHVRYTYKSFVVIREGKKSLGTPTLMWEERSEKVNLVYAFVTVLVSHSNSFVSSPKISLSAYLPFWLLKLCALVRRNYGHWRGMHVGYYLNHIQTHFELHRLCKGQIITMNVNHEL
jgi:hypothetical protein